MPFKTQNKPLSPQPGLRSPEEVMKLERMGAFFPTRLSFMRTTIRRLAAEKTLVRRPVWQIDSEGFGRAVYSLEFGDHTYSLVAFSNKIPAGKRTDRVIAEVWDSAYVLYDGIPDGTELDRLQENTPKQEAGRFLPQDLVLSRANKSLRLFEHVVESLSKGEQPDAAIIGEIGYLMRTTAVYGNGKFGIADRARIQNRPGLSGPFQAEMITVWLVRTFTHDLVEHIARQRSPHLAVNLDPDLKRHLGVGNSTGLGMAPFLVSHPILLNNWIVARETALAQVRALDTISSDQQTRLLSLAERAHHHLEQWNVSDSRQMTRVEVLRGEWRDIIDALPATIGGRLPVEAMLALGDGKSMECQELLVALALEPFGDIVDALEEGMASDAEPKTIPSMTVRDLAALINADYQWALKLDLDDPAEAHQFWYVSEEKLEPRLGNRFEEEGAERELPHDIARRVQNLVTDLEMAEVGMTVARFLMACPEHRYIVRRAQTLACHPYAEIRDNLVGRNCLPIDMLRCKLSFFGASKFDPKSDRWTRITLYQGAPLAEEIAVVGKDADDWWLPVWNCEGEKPGASS